MVRKNIDIQVLFDIIDTINIFGGIEATHNEIEENGKKYIEIYVKDKSVSSNHFRFKVLI